MSYDTIEAGVLKIVRKVSGFNANNTSQGEYKVLGSGVRQAVILTPGPFTRSVVAAPRRLRQNWTVNLELWIPFITEISEIASLIRTKRQELLDELDKWPRLDNTAGVSNAFATGGQEPTIWNGENRRWWIQVILIQVEERSTVTLSE